ncbi:hypothetical protein ABZX95_17375 [Streptomyces sp. NPDC004232]|uniref:hypothetical protein n=1 Tax=Streptomyces sp. NPDC004232 TaxID=3154454 RepID=UPI00339EE375
MTWERQNYTGQCDSCRGYWNVLQDLGEEWDADGRPSDPDGWGAIIGPALAMYLEHLMQHPIATRERPDA